MTPLSTIAQVASDQMSTVGRRTAVVAASSGLLVSMIGAAGTANASTTTNNESARLNTVDLDALTAQARAALESAPAVTVAADATFTIETAPVTVTPAPEPEPEPEPAPEPVRQQNTSRTEERVAPQERQQEAPQEEAPQEEAPQVEDNTKSEETPEDNSAADEADVPSSASGDAVVSIAARYLGVPYVYGGSTPNGFDCSGFTSYVYAQLGIDLPRTSSQQRYAGRVVSRSQAQPGDLIWSPGHIAIYVGGNRQIEAPVPGKTVHYSNIWQSNPTFIRVL